MPKKPEETIADYIARLERENAAFRRHTGAECAEPGWHRDGWHRDGCQCLMPRPTEKPTQEPLTLEEACAQVSAAVYNATALFERLEGVGHLLGNGHHARQKLAQLAVEDLKARWRGPTG